MHKKYLLLFLTSVLFSGTYFAQCTVSIISKNPSCHGTCDGLAKAVPAGGSGPYTYSWSTTPSQTTQVASGLCAGTYTVNVINGTACTATQTITLTQPVVLVTTTTQTNVKCNSGTHGTATAHVTGGTAPYTYSWSSSPVQTTATATNLPAGTYTLTVTDKNGCLSTAHITITQPAAISPVVTTVNSACGASNGSAAVSVTGGTGTYTYSWNTTPSQTTSSISNLPSGNYTVLVTDSNGCGKTAVATVGSAGGLTATTTQTNVSCHGGSNGTALVAASGGTTPYSYSWSTFPVQTTASITGLPAGTYYVSVKDGAGCSFTSTVIITQPPVLSATVTHTNVNCDGGSDGTATVTPAGGKPAYAYSWNTTPVQTTAVASGLTAGAYTVVVTDQNGCTLSKVINISQPVTLLTLSVSHTNDKCHGGTGASATANPAGGTAPYTYSWSTTPVKTTKTITGLGAATYYIKVTDSKGCTALDSVVISQPPPVALSTSTTQAHCGSADGSATVAITSGGVKPFTYSWNTTPVQTTATATNEASGIYKVTVTDSNGCRNTATVTITDIGGPVITLTSTHVTCRGTATGTATASVSGGTAPYTYSWSSVPSQNTATATGLRAGTYTVIVTSTGGCSTSAVVIIKQPAAVLSATVTVVNITCNGSADGSATAHPAGGTPAYTYSWSTTPVQTTATAANLGAGTYTLTIKDSSGCTINKTATITQPAAILLTVAKTNVTCNGDSTGDASVTASGGTAPYTYSWSTTPPKTTRTITGLTAGTYTVMVTDSRGCTKKRTVTITQPTPIVLTSSTVNAHCGSADGSATISASGGTPAYKYSWSTTPPQTTATINNLVPGVYTVHVTDSVGCVKALAVNVTNATAPTATVASTSVTCHDSASGSATVTLTGGTAPYTYSWSTTPPQTVATAIHLTAGTYSVQVTDAHGCITFGTATINQPPAFAISVTKTNVSCTATANGSAQLTVTGGTGQYTYSWSTTPAQTTATAGGLAPGTYTASIKDSLSCPTSAVVTIIKKSISASTTSVNLICNGINSGSATAYGVNGTNPYTYSWSTVPVQTTATATSLGAGTYTVSVTDSAGCQASTTVTLTQPAALAASTTQVNPVCYGGANGSASVSVSGGSPGYQYSWSTAPSQTTSTATGLTAGTFTITVKDTNSCVLNKTVTITQPAIISMTSTASSAHCGLSDGSAAVTASGGTPTYTYSWNTSPVQTTSTATGLAAGTYTVSISDMAGCSQSFGVVVGNTGGPVLTPASTPASCSNSTNGTASVTVTGGTSPYTYSWSTTPLQTGATATGLSAGTYMVQVADAAGCVTPVSVTVTSPGILKDSITAVMVKCNGGMNGSAQANVTGGSPAYTYSWSTTPVQTAATATGLGAGSYTLTVTDAQGCTGMKQVIIQQPAVLAVTTSSVQTTCNGSSDGSATATVTGGSSPYHYSWSTSPGQTTKTAAGLVAGIYSVSVIDSNGCSISATVTLTQPAPIVLAVSTVKASCGNFDGSATVSVTSGGSGPFTYLWTPSGQVTAAASNLNAGKYLVSVTDANGCSQMDSALVSNSGTGPAVVSVLSGCAGANNASATATMASGSMPFTYSWSTVPVQTSSTASGLSPGSYTVMVTDSLGCLTFATVAVTNPVPLVIDSIQITHISCVSCSDAFATIALSGGGAPYTYSWSTSPVQTTATASRLTPGTYTVCVTDANGCTLCDSVVIDNTVGIEVYAGTLSRMTLYPNPTSGTLNIQIQSSESQDVQLRVSNLLGELLYVEKITVVTGIQQKSCDFSAYPKGMYILQVITGHESAAQRFILK
ncbi:MAG: T9SS type A sorting domain-containing protein [Bacteroidia bacterium]